MPERADVFLVEHGFASTRAEAQAAIKAGRVMVDGKRVTKPAQTLHEGQQIIFEKEHPYVSRGALKLIAALDHFDLSPKDRICLDIGASTGGFTQVLLERGAARVFAIDVGHDQLHQTVAADPRVTSYEGVNARDLTTDIVTQAPEAIVIDVSFISLMLALPRALEMAAKDGVAGRPGQTAIRGRPRTCRQGRHRARCGDRACRGRTHRRMACLHRRLAGARIDRKPHRGRRRQSRISSGGDKIMSTLCRHFGPCGGCLLQDMPQDEYRARKRQLVVDALAHHGVEGGGCRHRLGPAAQPPPRHVQGGQ